ncbi:beta-glucosidase [Lysobacter korlensis]|uniref:Beta-glucosidase n=1 Tax=Lysobacter korlensis TaxID=553636 RepID=A0ABV6RP48_9GAMM
MSAGRTTADFVEKIEALSLEQKARLVTGADFWSTIAVPEIGLRSMVMSDGPAGVRGPAWDERDPSLNLPSATALAAAWDVRMAYRYGAAAAAEARRKDVDVVLGPTINLHRSPLGGRHFEAFSEDPLLSGELAAAYVRGLQDNGVAATPKHYVANDSETDRFTVDVRVDERTLREVYLLPFEYAVEAGAWAIMSAYNSVNGTTMSEHDLLQSPLSTEWGFDGVVVSDWTAVRSLAAADAWQDLAMPGPEGAWGDALIEAVRDGRIAEAALDRKVERLLRLAARVGALDGAQAVEPAEVDGPAFAAEAAREGMVLLRNERELPWDPAAISSIAVIGHNALEARTQGGGSATVIPDHVVNPRQGVIEAFPDAHITYSLGAVVQEGLAQLELDELVNPVTGEPGVAVRFLDGDRELFAEHRRSTELVWFGGSAPIGASTRVILSTRYTPDSTGILQLGFASPARGRLFIDEQEVLEGRADTEGLDLATVLLAPPALTTPVALTAGVTVDLRCELDVGAGELALGDALSLTVGVAPDRSDPEGLRRAAVDAARAADVAVVVVGTNAQVESEGFDRTDLSLPGDQDELVRAVARANPRTVVVINSGAPVLLPWREEVAAVLLSHFGGQEFGVALGAVLSGAAEPGGRLTTSWPAAIDDVPVLGTTPTDGRLSYGEGIHIGYRAWLRSGAEPAYPFGYGLGYTHWALDDVDVVPTPDSAQLEIRVRVRNAGQRPGKQVVQLYAERSDGPIDRPVRWLVGFGTLRAEPGETATVAIPVRDRALAHWTADGWRVEPGRFTLRAAFSAADAGKSVSIDAPIGAKGDPQ